MYGAKKEKKKEKQAQTFVAYTGACSFSRLLRWEKAVPVSHGSEGYNSGEERTENKCKGEAEPIGNRQTTARNSRK